MNQKIVLGLFIVAIGAVVLGMAEFTSLEQYQALPPIHHLPFVATTTPQAITPQPVAITPPQTECSTSRGRISTSTWATFTDRKWKITFQYPSSWKIVKGYAAAAAGSGPPDLNISGDGYVLNIQ